MTVQMLLQPMIPAIPLLMALSLIILIGYIGKAIFRRTKVPEALILILIGVLLVPVAHLLPQSYVDSLRSIASVFGDFALVVIMFNAGKVMSINTSALKGRMGLLIGVVDVLGGAVLLCIVMYLLFGWPPVYGALLGAVLGETSTAIVAPLIRKIRMSPSAYATLLMETSVNSVVAIMLFAILLSLISGQHVTAGGLTQYVVDSISVSIVLGVGAGLAWLGVQSRLPHARDYLPTIAVALLLFGVSSIFDTAAPISVLVFSVILGNYNPISKYLGTPILIRRSQAREINAVERSMELIITTFFFVFIGIIASVSFTYAEYAAAATITLVAMRYVIVRLAFGGESAAGIRPVALSLMQRGTTAAVLAALFLSSGTPYGNHVFYTTFLVIIATNLVAGAVLRASNPEIVP